MLLTTSMIQSLEPGGLLAAPNICQLEELEGPCW